MGWPSTGINPSGGPVVRPREDISVEDIDRDELLELLLKVVKANIEIESG